MTGTTTDFFDNLGGGGAPSAVLSGVNDWVQGEILEMFKKDYVPFGKTDPEKNQDGTTRQQLVIILQTTLRNWAGVSKIPFVDPNDHSKGQKPPSDDDGKRAVYVPERSNIQYAIADAVRTSKARFEAGGTLAVKVHNLKDTGKGNPLKEHTAVYTAPSAGAGFFPPAESAPAAAPAQQAPPAQPSPAAQPAAAPAAQDPWATPAAQPAAAPAASAPAGDPWATSAAPAAGNPPPF